tara:strand:+ start:1555 stop:2721 length:1167 start_codon:yes stop_codon:yes gene_type:complete
VKIKDRIIDFKRVKASSLHPHPRNWRTHPDNQKDALKGVLAEIGYADALVVRKDGNGFQILDGHLRAETTPDAQVPILVTDLNDDEADKFLVTHDPLGALASTDDDNLKHLLAGVETDSQALTKMLEDMADLDITPNDGLTDEDDVPETPSDPITKPGDMILLGDHRLLCGDSTNADNMARLMDGERADVVLTDPPYGLGDSVTKKNDYDAMDDSRENLLLLIDSVVGWCLKNVNRVVLTPGVLNHFLYPQPTWTMAWFCPAGVGRGPWGFCCWHPILCYGKDPRLSAGEGSYPDALVHQEGASCKEHPCAKPMEFWRWLLKRTTNAADLVFDPFMGSGTTMIACESDGRRCFGVEISPAYCDVIVQRWENYTGKKAERKTEPQLAGV